MQDQRANEDGHSCYQSFTHWALSLLLTSASPLTPIFPLIISTVTIMYVLSQVGVNKIEREGATSHDATKDNDERPERHDQR